MHVFAERDHCKSSRTDPNFMQAPHLNFVTATAFKPATLIWCCAVLNLMLFSWVSTKIETRGHNRAYPGLN